MVKLNKSSFKVVAMTKNMLQQTNTNMLKTHEKKKKKFPGVWKLTFI